MSIASPRVEIKNRTRESVVCAQARLADTFSRRLFGLLGETSLAEGDGLLIEPSSGVHTFAMSMPIDIVALNREYRVVGLWPRVGPWKVRALGRHTRRVLELPSGHIERCGLTLGDSLDVARVAVEPATKPVADPETTVPAPATTRRITGPAI